MFYKEKSTLVIMYSLSFLVWYRRTYVLSRMCGLPFHDSSVYRHLIRPLLPEASRSYAAPKHIK